MCKIATPELKRVAAAMKSAENGFFHHSQPDTGKTANQNGLPRHNAAWRAEKNCFSMAKRVD